MNRANTQRGSKSRGGMRALGLSWLLLILGIGAAAAWVGLVDQESAPVAKLQVAYRVSVPVAEGPPATRPATQAVAIRVQPGSSGQIQIGGPPASAPAQPDAARAAAEEAPPRPVLPPPARRPPPQGVDAVVAAGGAPTAPPPSPAPAEARPTPPAAAQPAQPPSTAVAQATARPPARPAPQRNGQPPWVANARNFDANDRRARIAIVLTDMGLSAAAAEVAIRHLPPEITFAFNPYANGVAQIVQRARTDGHEVLLNLPMEPNGYPTIDPGPQTLLTRLSAKENVERLDLILAKASGYVGVNEHLGTRFSTSAEAMKPVLEALGEHGLMYLDSRDNPRSVGGAMASELRLPRALNDRFLDTEPSREAIDARLAELEQIARESGSAVAIGHPLPVTFERLTIWIPTLPSKGIVLAPITAVANRQSDR